MQQTDMHAPVEETGVVIATSGPGATNLVTGECHRLYGFHSVSCHYR